VRVGFSSTIDEISPLDSIEQEEEYKDQLLITNKEYRELQMALDDCKLAHTSGFSFRFIPTGSILPSIARSTMKS